MTNPPYAVMANALRFLAADAVEKAGSGHPGMPMGMADVAAVLFCDHIKIDPSCPLWADRDRFVLSAGHGSMLLYALSHLLGYAGMSMDQIKKFRQLGAHTAGHPEYDPELGVETTTGPLGQGLGNAVGMAMAEQLLRLEYGSDLVSHYTYVMAGDGCLMEGISQEALSFAGHHQLSHLIVLFDDNRITIDGPTSLSTSDDTVMRFKASDWHVLSIDGHDTAAIGAAIQAAKNDPRPSLIACRTTIGYGAPTKAGTSGIHGSPLGFAELTGARAALNWPHDPFEIPDDIRAFWLDAGKKGQFTRTAWTERLSNSPHMKEFSNRMAGIKNPQWIDRLTDLKKDVCAAKKTIATRTASGNVLDVLVPILPSLIGGSADLTPSNNTKCPGHIPVMPGAGGNYIYYGIREHAMVSIMNGLCVHGGFQPYGGTFLAFSDYCRPAIRLAALMGLPITLVMTHDSIGLGEDGPTHQPVEHLAALRAIPNLNVFRPCDGVEVAECWEIALNSVGTPSLMALSRQNLPHLRPDDGDLSQNMSQLGGYVVRGNGGPDRDVTLIATGSEVSLAVAAFDILTQKGIRAVVVSMPCFELFDNQSASYKLDVLGPVGLIRVGVEAAISFGWDKYLGENGIFVGMTGFGASAPAPDLYQHFGITPNHIVDRVMAALNTGP